MTVSYVVWLSEDGTGSRHARVVFKEMLECQPAYNQTERAAHKRLFRLSPNLSPLHPPQRYPLGNAGPAGVEGVHAPVLVVLVQHAAELTIAPQIANCVCPEIAREGGGDAHALGNLTMMLPAAGTSTRKDAKNRSRSSERPYVEAPV
jgi:hypothetical protein